MDWELIGHILGVIIPIILGHLGIKGYAHKRAKKNGGTLYDKITRVESNQKALQVEQKNTNKRIDEVKQDIRDLRKTVIRESRKNNGSN